MICIGVCDNDEKDLNNTVSILEEFFRSNQIFDGSIKTFSSSKKLKESIEKEIYDMYILDVIMPDYNGIDLAKMIRSKNNNTPIIFTSSSREYAFDAFGVHAISYLEKPIEKDALFNVLDFSISLYKTFRLEAVLVNTNNGIVSIPPTEIVYVENVSRRVVYTLDNGEEVQSRALRTNFETDLMQLSQNPSFIQPHKSFFVNMNYIHKIQSGNLILDNGKVIPISRNKIGLIKKQYLKFMTER